jgi:hypothetical protein
VKNISGLKNLQDRAIGVLCGFGTIEGLVQVRIERLSERISSLGSELRNVVQKLFVNQLEAFAVVFVFRFAMSGKSVFKTIDDGDKSFDDAGGGAFGIFGPFFLDALAVIVEVGLATEHCLTQFVKVRGQLGHFGVGFCGIRSYSLRFRGLLASGAVSVRSNINFNVLVSHLRPSLMPIILHVLLNASLKSWAT